MRFNLIDSIVEVTDHRVVATKNVSLAEEYLADHFPTFPVLPGVLMLEALVQAAGWLLHRRNDFSRSMAVLKDARNIRYGTFVAPGDTLRVEVDAIRFSEAGGLFKAAATVAGNAAVSGRIEMAYFNLADRQAELAEIDRRLIAHNRGRWAILQFRDEQISPA